MKRATGASLLCRNGGEFSSHSWVTHSALTTSSFCSVSKRFYADNNNNNNNNASRGRAGTGIFGKSNAGTPPRPAATNPRGGGSGGAGARGGAGGAGPRGGGPRGSMNAPRRPLIGSAWKGRGELDRERTQETLRSFGFLPHKKFANYENIYDWNVETEEDVGDMDASGRPLEADLPLDDSQIEDGNDDDWHDDPFELTGAESGEFPGDADVTDHIDPDWYRDFSKARSTGRLKPSNESIFTMPTSWYEYQPYSNPPMDWDNDAELGMDVEEEDGLERVVYMGRHTKVTKGGRLFTFSAMIIDGDGEGTAGYGYGRGEELAEAIQMARKDLKRNLIHIDRFESRTLAHPIRARFCKSTVQLFVYPTRGVWVPRSSYQMECVFEAFGLENVAGKFIGNRNPKNMIKALFKAIQQVEHPKAVAQRLGVKWFDPEDVWRPGKPRVWTY